MSTAHFLGMMSLALGAAFGVYARKYWLVLLDVLLFSLIGIDAIVRAVGVA